MYPKKTMNNLQMASPFHVKDCTLAAIATGVKAHTLVELRDKLLMIPPSSIYYHFWGGRLRTSFEYREYHNDFSYWAHHCLHDDVLAERLELLNPKEYETMEELCNEIVDIVENRLDERELYAWIRGDEEFHFMISKIVVFQTQYSINHPHELVEIFPLLTRSSLFYHFIDAVKRVPEKIDDFSLWLQQFQGEYEELITVFKHIDPYLTSLSHLQQQLTTSTAEYFQKSRGGQNG